MNEEIENTKETKKIKSEKKKESLINKLPLQLRGKYLPHILVKVGLFYCNSEARKYIRNTGILVNGEITKNIDYELSKDTTYEIIFSGIEYQVTII